MQKKKSDLFSGGSVHSVSPHIEMFLHNWHSNAVLHSKYSNYL